MNNLLKLLLLLLVFDVLLDPGNLIFGVKEILFASIFFVWLFTVKPKISLNIFIIVASISTIIPLYGFIIGIIKQNNFDLGESMKYFKGFVFFLLLVVVVSSKIENEITIKEDLLVEPVETKLSDYASTFLLIINSSISTFTAHIGDGFIVGFNRKSDDLETNNQIISLPRNGEYENETYFFTDNNWKENIRFNFKKEPYDTCLIMSDGADKFWISSDRKSIARPLFEGFIKIRDKHLDKDLTTVLENVFTFEKISKVDSDDSTIGMILR